MGKSETFLDFNFKLVVIEAVLEINTKFADELKSIASKYVNRFEWYAGNSSIVEIVNYLEELTLNDKDLDKIENLCFDGGNEIYHIIKPDWDGEDDLFDVVSIEGFQNLKQLKTVDYYSMCNPKVLIPFEKEGIKVRY